ncbi:PspC domain-containing protein [Nocardioides bizhenqiangii]|uniref:PspC domain-containing protein n=1 Tax=Nocardioides bizhenqiangii TaxID=3095076 RepID=A0ABZ0ZQ69_9ACTN|nr:MULTISPECIES: PspC domain-containing protein [unclassified Nocardioides]MDZ5619572.1 PspC domain-containing protein [Nocardioides sp. HM23]WQQ26412.1 PspC domain-containing protein [Nocardioides sp. HM61]
MTNYEPYPPPVPAQPARPRTLLVRSRSDKMVAGVCGGFADFTGFDVNLIRILLVAATVLGAGSPIIVYLAAWILMPEGD